MKHKLITFIIVIALLAAFAVPSFAGDSDSTTSREVIYYSDGSYDVIETAEEVPQFSLFAATKTKTASRVSTHYDHNIVTPISTL